jgi:hypothetical protein
VLKIYKKISFALTKYASSRFVFGLFGSLEFSRRSRVCPPAHSEPREARRGEKQVRAIFRIHRQSGFCKRLEAASLRSAANLYSFFGENEMRLSIRAKEIF